MELTYEPELKLTRISRLIDVYSELSAFHNHCKLELHNANAQKEFGENLNRRIRSIQNTLANAMQASQTLQQQKIEILSKHSNRMQIQNPDKVPALDVNEIIEKVTARLEQHLTLPQETEASPFVEPTERNNDWNQPVRDSATRWDGHKGPWEFPAYPAGDESMPTNQRNFDNNAPPKMAQVDQPPRPPLTTYSLQEAPPAQAPVPAARLNVDMEMPSPPPPPPPTTATSTTHVVVDTPLPPLELLPEEHSVGQYDLLPELNMNDFDVDVIDSHFLPESDSPFDN